MSRPTLATVVAALDRRFPPSLAEEWDRVGLVCGDPDDRVRRVTFAVDPTQDVVAEALAAGADLLVVHHPLLLTGVHSVAATTGKGMVLQRLIRGGCALFTLHTNADAAAGGTNATLAQLLELAEVEMLAATQGPPMDKLVAFVPHENRDLVLAALFEAGAGEMGEYDQCAYSSEGTGQFRPSLRADPYVGRPGEVTRVAESRIELVLARNRRAQVATALRRAHPYQEPAFDFVETVTPAAVGIGRVGTLSHAISLRDFAHRMSRIIPTTVRGVRVAGDPDALVHRVAICSGAGDSLLRAARASGADVYVTSDLRHHPVLEHQQEGGCPIVEVSHWAGEWPWLQGTARDIADDLAALGLTVETHVSTRSTDPWSLIVGGRTED